MVSYLVFIYTWVERARSHIYGDGNGYHHSESDIDGDQSLSRGKNMSCEAVGRVGFSLILVSLCGF